MLRNFCTVLAACVAAALAPAALAQGSGAQALYFGGGLSLNGMANLDRAMGFQLFGGYSFGEPLAAVAALSKVKLDAEAGYMDSGKMKKDTNVTVCPPLAGCTIVSETLEGQKKGVWASGVARYALTSLVEGSLRLGYDFGDDKGKLYGIGVGSLLTRNLKLRAEWVNRNDVVSWQLNLVYLR